MLIPLILTFGCLTFLCIGIAIAFWARNEMSEDSPGISNIIMLIAGVALMIFGGYCVIKSGEYYNKKEFTTSVPAQIDTTVTIKNGVADTLYTYHLIKEE